MIRTLTLALGLALASTSAQAGGFEAKTMRDNLSAREVERPLVIGKGWAEFGLGTDVKPATGYWDENGEAADWDNARWLYTTQRLDIRYGMARRGELYWSVKTHYVHLVNEANDTDIPYFGLGDPHFGVRYEPYRSVAPLTSIIVYGDYKAAAGNESPGNYVGGPTTFSAVVLTTGTPDVTLGARAKRQIGPIAITGGIAYVHRFGGLAQYLLETEYNQFAGRIKPGDIKKADLNLMVQVGPVALEGGALLQLRDVTKVGNSSKGFFQSKNLTAIEGSDGWSLDALTSGTLNLTRGLDLVAAVSIPLRGEDLQFFPIEDLQPTRGNTYSGTIEFRYCPREGHPMKRIWSRILAASMLLGGLALTRTAEAKFVFPWNHPDLEWYTIETEHFSVHYSVSRRSEEQGNAHELTSEWGARKFAKVAEESWAPMCAQFNYYLKEKIHIVAYNQPDDLVGFTIPPWDWIVISLNPGGSFYRTRGRMEWISDVFVHEFAHVVSLKANAAHAEGMQGILIGGLYEDGVANVDTGAEFFIFDGDSVFWTEGGAEYWSDQTGYNWWTPSRDQFIRNTVLGGRLLEYEEWHSRAGKGGAGHWADGERYYQQGYSFGQYLRQRFGDQTYSKFALEYAKRWRPAWETVIEDVLGVDAHTLYDDWRAYVTERYGQQYDRVKARGEVVGAELRDAPDEWDYRDPEARDEWMSKKVWNRERPREKTGSYQFEPRVRQDAPGWGSLSWGTIMLWDQDPDEHRVITGMPAQNSAKLDAQALLSTSNTFANFDYGWDYVPGKDALVLVGTEDHHPRGALYSLTGVRLETDGYDWNRLLYYDFQHPREKKDGNRRVKTRATKHFAGKGVYNGKWYAIPNTERGQDPSVSPDGTRIAYFEYTDTNLNLVTINLDGSDKKSITTFDDGTWLQTVDWSPDGSQLVFGIYRNYQQNLYTVDADGSNLTPIMWDQWEEMDAHWAHDGKIYFAADPDGIFNIYSYDPSTKDYRQLTNVIGGAVTPQLTRDGNLIYLYNTAFGWKVYGLPADQFLNAPANHLFRSDYDPAEVEAVLAFREDLSGYEAMTTRYKPWRAFMPPTVVPIFRLENDSRATLGLQGGVQIFAQDYSEDFGGVFYTLLGEDILVLGQFFYQGWYPNFYLMALHYRAKFEQGYLLDEDQDPTTTDDQYIYEQKGSQQQNLAIASMDYPFNENFTLGAWGRYLEYGLKGVDDVRYLKYIQEYEGGINAVFSNNAFFSRSANPRYGRTITVDLTHAWTDFVYEPTGGVTVDDGEQLDKYQYNKGEIRWVENIPIPTFGSGLLQKAREHDHTLQLDVRVGMVDRNVVAFDEFRAGGQHPYNWGNGTLRPNTQFAGYPGYSLSGETMGMANLAYRFPIDRELRKKVGPLFIYGIYAQLGGTAGNLWSYRPPTEDGSYYKNRYGERIAYDAADVRREIPFVDYAYKNGNWMLYDASAELRMQSVLFHGATWDSFLRFAYGFNEIRGYGDVNGDDLYDTSENAFGDELSNETEKPGLRVYIGLGTGW